jgi:hypothetical protein
LGTVARPLGLNDEPKPSGLTAAARGYWTFCLSMGGAQTMTYLPPFTRCEDEKRDIDGLDDPGVGKITLLAAVELPYN